MMLLTLIAVAVATLGGDGGGGAPWPVVECRGRVDMMLSASSVMLRSFGVDVRVTLA